MAINIKMPYWIMLIIEMAKIELTGGHIEIFANYRDGQNIYARINGGHIIEMAKIELIGGHIGFIVFI